MLFAQHWHIPARTNTPSVLEELRTTRGLPHNEVLYWDTLTDPMTFDDMPQAVQRIQEATKKGEKILVMGDYDVDGITATAFLYEIFEAIGIQEKTVFRLPHRVEDGYGLSKKIVQEAIDAGITLIITVDNGISCHDECEMARLFGIDVIITDHHSIGASLPEAVAVVNPNRFPDDHPCKKLSGVGVAFKLGQALLVQSSLTSDEQKKVLAWNLDLVALGTIADCVPLTGENRHMVQMWLKTLSKTPHAGKKALVEHRKTEGKNLRSEDVAFYIAPLINAAGRLGGPQEAFALLTARDTDTAALLKENLTHANDERKKIVWYALKQAKETINMNEPLLTGVSAEWPKWVVGLIAGRLTEQTGKPSIIFTENSDGTITWSARSSKLVDIIGALRHFDHLLLHYGGHKQAAGMTLKQTDYTLFVQGMQSFLKETYTSDCFEKHFWADAEITAAEMTLQTAQKLAELEPFGVGNDNPLFACRNITIREKKVLWQTAAHLRVIGEVQGVRKSFLFWNGAVFLSHPELQDGTNVDILFRMGTDIFRDEPQLKLEIVDIQLSETAITKSKNETHKSVITPRAIAVVQTDGASRGNPWAAGIGAVLRDHVTRAILQGESHYLWQATNNQSEYNSLLLWLRLAKHHGVRDIRIEMDSQLVVRQVLGEYQVKNAELKPLHTAVQKLLQDFETVSITHIPREQNSEADALSNEAIDKRTQSVFAA